jgi:hypothetical protein
MILECNMLLSSRNLPFERNTPALGIAPPSIKLVRRHRVFSGSSVIDTPSRWPAVLATLPTRTCGLFDSKGGIRLEEFTCDF